ncbi:hypothetical protein [Limimaricola sp.]|nr:hypothetical protein [Limimaricola sp.]
MQTLTSSYRGLSFLIDINRDRLVAVVVILMSLWVASHIGVH